MKTPSNSRGPFAWHPVIRAQPGNTPLEKRDACVEAWRRLRHAFPDALSAVLMPTHVHLLVPGALDPALLPSRLARALNSVAPGTWETPPPPVPVPDWKHLSRQARYLALNPCRDRLCEDPLLWEWSTHLDVLGFVADPWIPWSRIAGWAGRPDRWHAYVSCDPSVRSNGTPPPGDPRETTRLTGAGSVPGSWLAGAVLLATRSGRADLRRHKAFARAAFLEAATRHRPLAAAEIREVLGPISRQSLHLRRHRAPSSCLSAALRLILGDPRTLGLALRIP